MKNEELLNFKVLGAFDSYFPTVLFVINGDFPMKNMGFLLAVMVFCRIFAT